VKSCMPIASSDSRAIKEACHRPAYDKTPWLFPVKWLAVPADLTPGGVERHTFTTMRDSVLEGKDAQQAGSKEKSRWKRIHVGRFMRKLPGQFMMLCRWIGRSQARNTLSNDLVILVYVKRMKIFNSRKK